MVCIVFHYVVLSLGHSDGRNFRLDSSGRPQPSSWRVKDSLAPIPVLILESASIKSKILKINSNVFSMMSFLVGTLIRFLLLLRILDHSTAHLIHLDVKVRMSFWLIYFSNWVDYKIFGGTVCSSLLCWTGVKGAPA